MEEGTRVKVIDTPYARTELEYYPFMPDLIGSTGEIVKVQMCSDGAVYHVRMDEPFKVGVIPEGQSAFDYKPTEWHEETTWAFTEEEIDETQET